MATYTSPSGLVYKPSDIYTSLERVKKAQETIGLAIVAFRPVQNRHEKFMCATLGMLSMAAYSYSEIVGRHSSPRFILWPVIGPLNIEDWWE